LATFLNCVEYSRYHMLTNTNQMTEKENAENLKEKICHDLAVEAAKLSFLRDETSSKDKTTQPLTKPGEIADELRKNYTIAKERLEELIQVNT